MASVSPMAKRPQGATTPEARDQAEIDTLMRRFFEQNRSDIIDRPKPAEAEAPAAVTPPRRDFEMATELLQRAAQAFDVLVKRCQRLERDLEEADERAKGQIAERDETLEQWKRLGAGLKAQLEASDQALSTLKAKCDAAEVRAARAEQRIFELEQTSSQVASQAALAEELSTKLHDSVVMAFGVGSRAHPVLEAVATQPALD